MNTPYPPSPRPSAVHLPAVPAWQCIDFISDLHVAPETPKTFQAWADYLRRTRADAVFILGDLFEVWLGDDARNDEFEAACGEVLREASTRKFVAFMAGNRDFLVGREFLDDCGVVLLHDPTVLQAFGEPVLLTHGDALCLADTPYQAFRAMVRSSAWQRNFLTQTLGVRRKFAKDVRAQSQQRKRQMPSPEKWADVDPTEAVIWLSNGQARTMIHGHTHRPGTQMLEPGYTRHVLSDWDLDDPATPRSQVLRLTSSGFERLPPDEA